MSKKQHIIERTIYPELVKLLESIGFSDVLGESKAGKNRNYTDVTFSYKETNFLAEIKFGNTSDSGVNHKIFSQAYRYAKEKNIENFLILVYPNDLSGHVYLGSEWFTDQCINNKIRCYIFTSKWSDEILDSPKNIFKNLKRVHDQEKAEKPSMGWIVKLLQSAVKDLNRVNNHANKTNMVKEVVDKLNVFIGVGGFEAKDENRIKTELVNLSTYLLFNQLLFYRIYRVRVENNDLPPLQQIEKISKLQEFFNLIEKKGYSAIYSSRILNHLKDEGDVIDTINDVIDALEYIRPEIITHDIAGIFFHKLIPFEIRKVLATFFTVPNAADLLAGLSIKNYDSTILDPACGSGTLLVASYKSKKKIYEGNFGTYTVSKMHKQFLENDITGYDIMPFSGHLTAMNLSMQNIEQQTKIVRVGSGDSLDLATQFISKSFSEGTGFKISKFETHTQETLFPHMDKIPDLDQPDLVSREVSGALSIDGKGAPFKLVPQDIVIMNPPFSDIEKIAKVNPDMLDKLKNNKILSEITGNQGNLWVYFLALANLALKESGRVGAVIPITLAVGEATQKIRKFLLTNFSTNFIVKPSIDDKAFSQNASFKDILFIADKRKPTVNDKTAIISFKSSVKEMEESRVFEIVYELQGIYANNQIGYSSSNNDYDVRIISTLALSKNTTGFMPFLVAPELFDFVEKIRELGKNIFRKINANDMHEGYHLSPAGTSNLMCVTNPIHPSRIKQGAFLILKERQKNSIVVEIKNTDLQYKIPLSHTTNFMRTLTGVKKFVISSLDYAITKKPEKFNEIVLHSKWDEKKRGKFDWDNHNKKLKKAREFVYVPCVFRPDSRNTHNFAFFSPLKFHTSNAFKAIVCNESDEGMFQTLLLNSSFAIALLLMWRSQTLGGKTNIHERAFYNFDIFDVSKLSKNQKSKLSSLYKKLEKVEFPSIKEQYEINFKFRRVLDLGILDVLGLEESKSKRLLDDIYKVFPDEFKVD